MFPWDVCIVPKDVGGLRLIDIVRHGCILATKWVVRCLEECAPWRIFLRHHILTTQHSGRVSGSFDLCAMISSPHYFLVRGSFIIKSIWGAGKKVAGLV